MANRIKEIDYLKGILIVLMVTFHLVYISDKYPYAKDVVYTFHMSAFLIISGYLLNIVKRPSAFFRDMKWIFIPYVFMEVCYLVMSSILPVRETVSDLTPLFIAYKTLLSPIGPYWYLHTLILCSITYFMVYRYVRTSNFSRFIILGLSFFVLSYVCNMISFANAIYFLIGVAVSQSKQGFTSIFRSSALAIVPLIILCSFPSNLNRGTLSGIAITFLAISTLLYLHQYLGSGSRRIIYTIGQNTFVILLFSPIFTIISKTFLPFFAFDPFGVCFMITAVTFTITGCFLIAYLIDKLRLTKICFGRSRILTLDDKARPHL